MVSANVLIVSKKLFGVELASFLALHWKDPIDKPSHVSFIMVATMINKSGYPIYCFSVLLKCP